MGAKEEVEKLKAIKAPLWAKLLGALNAAMAVRRVATVTLWFRDNQKEIHRGWLLFYERPSGDRSFEFRPPDTVPLPPQFHIEKHNDYTNIIRPWLLGVMSAATLKATAEASLRIPSENKWHGL